MTRWLIRGGIAGLVLLLGWLWLSGMIGVGLHLLAMRDAGEDWRDKGLWLADYQVNIEARPVTGVPDNLSGLTFSDKTGTLFAAINRPPGLVELSPDGRLLRHIALTGADDPEGITHVADNLFILSDEGHQRMDWIEITPETTEIRLGGNPHLTLALGAYDNMGFEGISWDQGQQELLIAQEMWPMRVLRLRGLAEAMAGQGLALEVSEWKPKGMAGPMLADLASLSAHDATGNLVLLSEMTSALVEYAPDGAPVSILPLWAGWHGLERTVPQPEGVALDPQGDIFIVSEPNLFYRFSRSRPAAWMKAPPEAG